MGLFDALAGNLQKVDENQLQQQYGAFLFDGEQISSGYQLIRDAVLFTNIRIIFIDRQGTTGAKMRIKTIHLDSVVDVEAETAGAFADDSEINITYLADVYQRKSGEERLETVKLEFPRKFDISPIYRYLGQLALSNRARINGK